MIAFYPTPDLFDLEGWRRHLEWLRSEPEEILARENAIERAEQFIAVLEQGAPPSEPSGPT